MDQGQWETIRPLVVDSCVSLFSADGTFVMSKGESSARQRTGDSMAGFVGIVSAQISGGIGLAMPVALIRRTHPLYKRGGEPTERNQADWLCELTNQLAGRVKNKLLPYGIAFRISTPMAASGKDLCTLVTQESRIAPLEFDLGGQPFYVDFTAHLTRGAILRTELLAQGDNALEGDVLVF